MRGLGHTLFTRGEPRSPLECAIDSFLLELGDQDPRYVEYWSRQEWKHIEAHADMDEVLAAREGIFQYPESAHVLYLKVGPRVRGPTCIWEPNGDDGFGGALTTVPAVQGRVVRFPGTLQHAVPRPVDVWLTPFAIHQAGSPQDYVRSVVLFNTWQHPPMGLDGNGDGSLDERTAALANPRAQWQNQIITPCGSSVSCAPSQMKIWLLGDAARRQRPERTLIKNVDAEALLRALSEQEVCTRLQALESPCG